MVQGTPSGWFGPVAESLIRIAPERSGSYRVDLAFTRPGSDAPTEPTRAMRPSTSPNSPAPPITPQHTVPILTRSLFADPVVKRGLDQASAVAEILQIPLRLRLQIDSAAPELHALRWETLTDSHGSTLATSDRILLSRYLRSPGTGEQSVGSRSRASGSSSWSRTRQTCTSIKSMAIRCGRWTSVRSCAGDECAWRDGGHDAHLTRYGDPRRSGATTAPRL